MSTVSPSVRGRFYWYELMTRDAAAAKAFYTQVVGWGVQPMEMPGMTYDMWVGSQGPTGGVVDLSADPAAAAVPPHWLAYFGTPDVDATITRALELGATVYAPAMDIPGIGRFAVLRDPQGAVFAPFTPATDDMEEMDARAAGCFAWHELYTSDLEAAWAFYGELFGWAKAGGMDMGPAMGEYRIFGRRADEQLGGFMKKSKDDPFPPRWLYYVTVPDLTGSLARVRELGGQVLWGPMEVPGGDTVATCFDPQGAMFALFQRGQARA